MANMGKCDLRIPNKRWSGDPLEEQNYLAIERWARFFHDNCAGGCSCWIGKKSFFPEIDNESEYITSYGFTDFTTLGTSPYGGGNCLVTCQAIWPDGGTGTREISLTSTNAPTANDLSVPAVGTTGRGQPMSVTHISQVNGVYFTAWQNSGGPLDIVVNLAAYEICGCGIEFTGC